MCGKPTFEVAASVAEPEPPLDTTPAATAAPPLRNSGNLPINFKNPIAVRVAFVMSLGVLVMELIPILNNLSPVWLFFAGSGAVKLYRRLTGARLSIRAGVRLGSITGVLSAVSFLIITSLTFAFAGNEAWQGLIKQNPSLTEVMNNPQAIAIGAVMLVIFMFALVIGICAAGGALGARLGDNNAKA